MPLKILFFTALGKLSFLLVHCLCWYVSIMTLALINELAAYYFKTNKIQERRCYYKL